MYFRGPRAENGMWVEYGRGVLSHLGNGRGGAVGPRIFQFLGLKMRIWYIFRLFGEHTIDEKF